MKNTLRVLILITLQGTAICAAQAQTQARDAVYLKNGCVIKGKVVEVIPGSTAKIQTADGSIYAHSMSEVEKITDDAVYLKNGSVIRGKVIETIPSDVVRIRTAEGSIYAYSMSEVDKITDGPNRYGVTIFAGISEPISYFGESYGPKAGRANTGFALGIDISRYLAPNVAWMSSANFSTHKSQIDGSQTWDLGWLMTGWMVTGNPSPEVEIYGFGQGGILHVRTPGSWFFNDSKIVERISIPDYTFGFGLGAGMNIDHISLSMRLLCSEPEYDLTVMDIIYDPYDGIYYTESYKCIYKQPTYCLQIAGGYIF
jgi:translation initiation factor IF-1